MSCRHLWGGDMSMYRGNKDDNRYKVWVGLRQRCDNRRDSKYPNYGGRGISYDPKWVDFRVFCADVGARPAGTSLDRFPDNDGDYTKGNVRWATPKQQANNRRPRTARLTALPNNSTGILGVCKLGTGKFRAQCKTNGVNTILYEGNSFELAVSARRSWEVLKLQHLQGK